MLNSTLNNPVIEHLNNSSILCLNGYWNNINKKCACHPGYKLEKLTVETDSGEAIDFKEEEMVKDSMEIYNISTNKFTMPYDNVTINAKWSEEVKNPDTGVFSYINIGIIILIISIISLMIIRKKKLFNK